MSQQLKELQSYLKSTKRYHGSIDGLWGRLTEAAIILMFTDGPDTPIDDGDLKQSANRLGVSFAQIKAISVVEANGSGFFDGRPKILPEPHRFSKLTGRRYDRSHPTISYPVWGTRPYPKTQNARYDQLLKMIRLDVNAGFSAASYGKFQILGENHKACGYESPMRFAEDMGRDEVQQLFAFEAFLKANNMVSKLKKCTTNPDTCRDFCKSYNGTGYAKNNYHVKIANEIRKWS